MASVKPIFTNMDGVHPKTDDFARLQDSLTTMMTAFATMFNAGVLYGLEPRIVGSDVVLGAGAVIIKNGFVSDIVKFTDGEIVIHNGALAPSAGGVLKGGKSVWLYKTNTTIPVDTRLDIIGQTKTVAMSDTYSYWIPTGGPGPDTSAGSAIILTTSAPGNGYNSSMPLTIGEITRNFSLRQMTHTDVPNITGEYPGPKLNGYAAINPETIVHANLSTNCVDSGNIMDGTIQTTDIANGAVTRDKITTIPGLRITTANIEDDAITGNKIADGAVSITSLSAGVIPVGTVLAYAGTNAVEAESGGAWLICNGRSLQRTGSYASLYAKIGTWWGSLDSTTFRIPDLRGMFLRGADTTDPTSTHPRIFGPIPNSPGDARRRQSVNTPSVSPAPGAPGSIDPGSYQTACNVSHGHQSVAEDLWSRWGANGEVKNPGQSNETPEAADWCSGDSHVDKDRTPVRHPAHRTSAEGQAESRPWNAYIYYIIKAL